MRELLSSSALVAAARVLLGHNSLASRFAQVPNGGHFVVGATGFANGLSFVATWQLWRQANEQPNACLHFIATERHPLTPEDLLATHAPDTDLSGLMAELIENYPADMRGTHRLVLDRGRVRLTLCFGDINGALQDLAFTADAWLLSGSAVALKPTPAPALVTEILDRQAIATIAEHSRPGTSFAAETSSTKVHEWLSDAGFQASRADGPVEGQQVLIGQMPGPENSPEPDQRRTQESIGIIGAGIAGCLLASNLAQRGFCVTLIDQAETVAAEASGNRQGALYVKLGVDFNEQTSLALTSLLFSQRFYRQFDQQGWFPTGLLQLAYSDSEADRQSRFLAKNRYPESILKPVNAECASRIAGIAIPHGGLWFPGSGWLQPAKVCKRLAEQRGIKQHMSFCLETLEQHEGRWRLTSNRDRTLTFDHVVLCAGADTPALIPVKGKYRMKSIRGQITEVPEQSLNAPSVVICGPGYVNPAFEGRALVGATFDLHDACPDVTPKSNRENLAMLAGLIPAAMTPSDTNETAEASEGRVAFRCTTHDYQPIAGLMKTHLGEQLSGLYLFTGLGSKGLTYSPLLAEYLADLLSGQPPCLPEKLVRRIETRRCHQPSTKDS